MFAFLFCLVVAISCAAPVAAAADFEPMDVSHYTQFHVRNNEDMVFLSTFQYYAVPVATDLEARKTLNHLQLMKNIIESKMLAVEEERKRIPPESYFWMWTFIWTVTSIYVAIASWLVVHYYKKIKAQPVPVAADEIAHDQPPAPPLPEQQPVPERQHTCLQPSMSLNQI
jgi:hypothetical protein